jgi:hypothetical protein
MDMQQVLNRLNRHTAEMHRLLNNSPYRYGIASGTGTVGDFAARLNHWAQGQDVFSDPFDV